MIESPVEEAHDERHHESDSEDDPPAIQRFMKHLSGNSICPVNKLTVIQFVIQNAIKAGAGNQLLHKHPPKVLLRSKLSISVLFNSVSCIYVTYFSSFHCSILHSFLFFVFSSLFSYVLLLRSYLRAWRYA